MLVCSNAILTANIVHPHDPIHQYVSSNALVNVILVMVVSSCCLTYWVYSESSTVSLLWHSHLKQQQTSFPDNFLWRRRVGEFKTFSINFFDDTLWVLWFDWFDSTCDTDTVQYSRLNYIVNDQLGNISKYWTVIQ